MARLSFDRSARCLIALLLLDGSGCRSSGGGEAPTAALGSPVVAARRLALIAPPGATAADKLIVQLQDRARQNPAKIDWWLALGQAWVRKARESTDPSFYVNADACAEVGLDIVPGAPLALDLRGLVLLNQHKFAAARDLAQALLSARPDDVMAWGTLSDAQYELGHFNEALEALQKMMELKPGLPAYSRASYFAWLQGKPAAAKEAIRHAIDASSANARDPEPRAFALVQAAMLFFHEGDYDGADAGFEMTLKLLRDFPPALVGRARVALAKGDGKRAAELLDRAYRQSPLVETAWLLADARKLAGDDPGAAEAYELAIRHGRRTDPRTLSLLLSTYQREPDEALRLAEAEHKVRGDLYTEDAYAFALYRKGRLDEARKAIDDALRYGTRDARLLYHAGAIRRAQGDRAGGDQLLREALALNSKFDLTGAADAARLLADQ